MAEGKKSFVLYTNYIDLLDGYQEDDEYIEGMTDEEAGKWIKTIFRYVNDREFTIPNEIRQAFILVRKDLKQDLKKYQAKVKSMENARKSNRNHLENKLKSNSNQLEINSDNDNVNDNDNDNVNEDNNIYVISHKKEEDNIETLQQLILMIECNICSHNLSNADAELIKNISDKGYSYNSIYRDLKNYKDKGIKTPIIYMKKALENAKIQEQVKPKQEEQEQKTYEINCWLDAFNIYYDEEAPQYIRDKAKKYMEDNKRGN